MYSVYIYIYISSINLIAGIVISQTVQPSRQLLHAQHTFKVQITRKHDRVTPNGTEVVGCPALHFIQADTKIFRIDPWVHGQTWPVYPP